jgi:hypothetical protein
MPDMEETIRQIKLRVNPQVSLTESGIPLYEGTPRGSGDAAWGRNAVTTNGGIGAKA